MKVSSVRSVEWIQFEQIGLGVYNAVVNLKYKLLKPKHNHLMKVLTCVCIATAEDPIQRLTSSKCLVHWGLS